MKNIAKKIVVRWGKYGFLVWRKYGFPVWQLRTI